MKPAPFTAHPVVRLTFTVAEMILIGYLKKRTNPTATEPGASRIYAAALRNSEVIGRRQDEKGAWLLLSGGALRGQRCIVLPMRRLKCHSVADLIRYAIRGLAPSIYETGRGELRKNRVFTASTLRILFHRPVFQAA